MKLKRAFCLALPFFWMLPAIDSMAHVSQPCLMLIEQHAEDLKHCVVKKQRENCRYDRQVLSDQVEVCRKQQFSDEEVVNAIRVGESRVKGNASYYLEPTAADMQNSANNVAKGNIENFSHQFPGIKAFPLEDLDAGANMGGCRRAFLAKGERYNFLGSLELKRYDASNLDKESPHTLYFFNRMIDGVCYTAPDAGQLMANGDRVVVNLPANFFGYLKRAAELKDATAVIVRCSTKQECNYKKRKALEEQVDYHATFLRLKRLRLCEEQAQAKGFFRRLIRLKPKKAELPAHCMEENLEKNIRSLETTLDEIAKRLFQ